MINEPTAKTVNGAMQNPRTRTGESTSTDPVRRNVGGKTEEAPKDADPAKVDDKDQVDEDAGEGHKGPRTGTSGPFGSGTSAKDPKEAKPTDTQSGAGAEGT